MSNIKPKSLVLHQGKICKVIRIESMTSIVILGPNKKELPVSIQDVRLLNVTESNQEELMLVSSERWEAAEKRLSIINEFIDRSMTKDEMQEIADKNDTSVATLYRWKESYNASGQLLTSLLPAVRSGGKGQSRIDKESEKILLKVINEFYLTPQKQSLAKTYKELERVCFLHKVSCPSFATLRKRVMELEEYQVVASRMGKRAADEKFAPKTGSFPDGTFPLQTVQIDHTKLDIMVIDSETGLTLGRPWLTLGIDVFSRMITGYCIGFEAPSILTTGICIANSILPKESILNEFDIDAEWPCWGLMNSIHTDNGKDFTSDTVKRACAQYGIETNFRPIRRPEFGGHIERLMGTIARELHSVEGTTFNDFRKRKNYKSEKKAILSLRDLEEWILTFITQIYHVSKHGGIGTSPLFKYKEGVWGTPYSPGSGIPEPVKDPDRLRIDFLPMYKRTIQDYGVALDGVYYYSDVLRSYINVIEYPDPRLSLKVKRKFVFRRDPRDISKLYFFDPETSQYFEIPYRTWGRPTISLWELRASKKLLKIKEEDIDEEAIFRAYDKLRSIETNAAKNKRKLRYSTSKPQLSAQTLTSSKSNVEFDELDISSLKPFDND